MIGPVGRLGAAATLRQHCPQMTQRQGRRDWTHLGQVPQVVCVEQELLEAPCVSAELLGDHGERAVPLVDVLHLPVAPLEDRDALEHGGGGGGGGNLGGEEELNRPPGGTG